MYISDKDVTNTRLARHDRRTHRKLSCLVPKVALKTRPMIVSGLAAFRYERFVITRPMSAKASGRAAASASRHALQIHEARRTTPEGTPSAEVSSVSRDIDACSPAASRQRPPPGVRQGLNHPALDSWSA